MSDRRGRSRSPSPRRDRSRSPRGRSRSPRNRSRSPGDREKEVARNPGNNLYVTGLSARVSERDLEDHFSREGKVRECRLVVDPRTKESRGFAFVTMDSLEDAERAIKYLDRSVLEGRVITVQKAKRSRARTPTPGQFLGVRSTRDSSSGREESYGRDSSSRRSPYGRDDYGRDPYGRDPYGRDPYARRSPQYSPYRARRSPDYGAYYGGGGYR